MCPELREAQGLLQPVLPPQGLQWLLSRASPPTLLGPWWGELRAVLPSDSLITPNSQTASSPSSPQPQAYMGGCGSDCGNTEPTPQPLSEPLTVVSAGNQGCAFQQERPSRGVAV